MRAYKIIYIGTCEGENKIVSHHLIFHTMQFQNRCKCLKIKEDLLYDAPLCQLGSSLVLLPLLHSSLKTLTSLRLFDSVAFLSQFSRDGEARRRHGGGTAAARRWRHGGVRKVQASPSLAALRKLLVGGWVVRVGGKRATGGRKRACTLHYERRVLKSDRIHYTL